MAKAKAKAVSWGVEDHLAIFKEMKKYYDKNKKKLPTSGNKDTFQKFLDNALPPAKHKTLHFNVCALLNMGFLSWVADEPQDVWYYKSKQHHGVKKEVITPVKEPIKIEQFELPEAIKAALSESNTVSIPSVNLLPAVIKALQESNSRITALDDKITKNHTEVMDYLGHIHVVTNKAGLTITNTVPEVVETLVPVKAPEPSIYPKVLELPKQVAKPQSIAEVIAGPLMVVQKQLTEDDVRRIVNEEIERIFGPTNVTTEKKETPPLVTQVPVAVTKPVIVVKPEQVLKEVLIEEAATTHETKQKFKVLVFGLTKPQVNRIIEKVSNNILIEGHEVYNNSTRDKAKRSDLVVVSRFSSHATYETLRSVCGLEKVVFVSGGVSMIQKKIVSLIDVATTTAAAK